VPGSNSPMSPTAGPDGNRADPDPHFAIVGLVQWPDGKPRLQVARSSTYTLVSKSVLRPEEIVCDPDSVRITEPGTALALTARARPETEESPATLLGRAP
jgi:hypothetical protein